MKKLKVSLMSLLLMMGMIWTIMLIGQFAQRWGDWKTMTTYEATDQEELKDFQKYDPRLQCFTDDLRMQDYCAYAKTVRKRFLAGLRLLPFVWADWATQPAVEAAWLLGWIVLALGFTSLMYFRVRKNSLKKFKRAQQAGETAATVPKSYHVLYNPALMAYAVALVVLIAFMGDSLMKMLLGMVLILLAEVGRYWLHKNGRLGESALEIQATTAGRQPRKRKAGKTGPLKPSLMTRIKSMF